MENEHNLDVSTPEKLASFMSEARSKEDWNKRCDLVKKVCNGYPDYWYETCIASGLINRTLGAGSSDINVSVIAPVKERKVITDESKIEEIGPTGINRSALLRRLFNK
jgi:hypothetical protein